MAPPSKRPPQGRKPTQGRRPPPGKPQSEARKTSGDGVAANGVTSGAEAKSDNPIASAPSSEETNRSAEERKAKREAARQERVAIARRKQKAKRQRQSIIASVAILALLGAIFYGVQKSRGEKAAASAAAQSAGCGQIQEVESAGREHRPLGEEIPISAYETNPPTSGPHYAERVANWGSYNVETPVSTLVHNLEHGGIIVHYKDQGDAQIDTIDSFVDEYADGVISNPNPSIDHPIVVTSWDYMQTCDEFNAAAVAGFISERCNKGPEKLTTCRR
ncbi:MAG: DUF3105 domain-containing protein [Actinomycetota bacterium]